MPLDPVDGVRVLDKTPLRSIVLQALPGKAEIQLGHGGSVLRIELDTNTARPSY